MIIRYSQFTKIELMFRVQELEEQLIKMRDRYEELYFECYGETMDDFIERMYEEYKEMMIKEPEFKGKIIDGKLSIEREMELKNYD